MFGDKPALDEARDDKVGAAEVKLLPMLPHTTNVLPIDLEHTLELVR